MRLAKEERATRSTLRRRETAPAIPAAAVEAAVRSEPPPLTCSARMPAPPLNSPRARHQVIVQRRAAQREWLLTVLLFILGLWSLLSFVLLFASAPKTIQDHSSASSNPSAIQDLVSSAALAAQQGGGRQHGMELMTASEQVRTHAIPITT